MMVPVFLRAMVSGLCLVLALGACVQEEIQRTFALPSCQNLRVRGNVLLELRVKDEQVQANETLKVSGALEAVNGFSMVHSAGRVSIESAAPEAVNLVVYCSDLRKLELLGKVHAQQLGNAVLGSDYERLAVYGESQLSLKGVRSEQLDIRVSGQGQLNVENIVADSIQVLASSASQIVLHGESAQLQLNVLGHGRVNTQALAAQGVDVKIGGDSRVIVHASAHLGGQVSDASELSYRGTPDLSVEETGSALIVKI